MFIVIRTSTNDLASDFLTNNIMIRNKIEKWILSEHHIKYPNLIVGLTIICSIILVGAMLFYIKCS